MQRRQRSHGFRTATWLRPVQQGEASKRLLVLAPCTVEETAMALGMSVEDAQTVATEQPLYLVVGHRRWISPN